MTGFHSPWAHVACFQVLEKNSGLIVKQILNGGKTHTYKNTHLCTSTRIHTHTHTSITNVNYHDSIQYWWTGRACKSPTITGLTHFQVPRHESRCNTFWTSLSDLKISLGEEKNVCTRLNALSSILYMRPTRWWQSPTIISVVWIP